MRIIVLVKKWVGVFKVHIGGYIEAWYKYGEKHELGDFVLHQKSSSWGRCVPPADNLSFESHSVEERAPRLLPHMIVEPEEEYLDPIWFIVRVVGNIECQLTH